MSTSLHDLFDTTRALPAEPGSYGEAPSGFRLPAETRLGAVRLQVAELARSLAFYTEVLGFRVLSQSAGTASLGTVGSTDGTSLGGTSLGGTPLGTPLVELVERPGARSAARRGRLGLYHVAILLPDRASLGRFVRHLGELGVRAGAGDHLVSEAFYLHDPDGLGIEVYADRPRAAWRRVGRQLVMATDPVDVPELVRAAGDAPWTGLPAGTTIGHVHLHVSDLARAAEFYGEALGFDRIVWGYPGALFLSAGGYHHHLGANTWAGPDAVPAGDDDARLLGWTLVLPDVASVNTVSESLARAGVRFEQRNAEVRVGDPWGTVVEIVSPDRDAA